MTHFLYALVFLFTNASMAEEVSSSTRNNSRCITALRRDFAPYVNLPETRGAFEHFQIRSESVGLTDLTYWDDTRELEGTDLRFRYIFTPTGGFQCTYPKSLSPSDLVFDQQALEENRLDILKRNRTLLPGAGINCRKTDLFPSELLNTYISWMPQLYGELLNDKSISSNWNSIAGNYTPSQINFNLEPCRNIPGPYRSDIARKLPRLQNNWDAIQSETQPGTAESSNAVD